MEDVSVWDRIVRRGTAMSICCAPLMCFGQAGVRGNGARLSVEEGFRLGVERVKMALTVLAAVWNINLVTPMPVQS